MKKILFLGYNKNKTSLIEKINTNSKKWSIKQTFLWSRGRLDFIKLINREKFTAVNLALLFATCHPAIKTVIPGMMTLSQIKQGIKSLSLKKLSKIEIEKIRNLYQSKTWVVKKKN